MARGDVYTVVHKRISVSTAITIIQLKAGTTYGFDILRGWWSQSNSTTSAQQAFALVRKSTAATVTAGVVGTTVYKLDPNAPTPDLVLSTSGTGITASAEGTNTDEVLVDAQNTQSGWLYLPIPEERIHVPPGGIIALTLMAAPAAALTISAGITIMEV